MSFFERAASFYRRMRPGLGAALIFLVVVAAYWPAIRGQFVWDDTLLVEKNPIVKGKLSLLSIWFRTDFPLTLTAFWLQWLAWGKNPAGYHAVNVLLHAIGALLVWRILARLKVQGAWLGAMIFAVHPVCAGTVAWISEEKNTLSLVFYLLSAWWYLRFDQQFNEVTSQEPTLQDSPLHAGRLLYWFSLGAFVLALLSKTSTVMLPVVLLLCAWWQRGRVTARDVLRTSPYFIVALGFGLLTIWFQTQAMTTEPVQNENFLGRLAGAGKAIWFYLAKDLLPIKLSMIYPRWSIDATSPLSYAPLLILGAVFVSLWRFRGSWARPVLFGLAYFTISLFPVLGFFDMYYLELSRVSDHFQYVALIGVAALVAAGLGTLLKEQPLRVISAILVLALSISTFHRARALANNETLWRDTLAKNPSADTAHNNLGCILAEQQKYEQAVTHFLAALKTNPRNAPAHGNLAKALALQGQFDEAESHFQTSLGIQPEAADIQRSFASTLAERGKDKEAVPHLQEALRLEPEAQTRLQLAGVLRKLGKIREAVAQYRQALLVEPESLEALNNLAWLLATCADDSVRDGAEAVRFADKACRLTRYQVAIPLGTLAAAYAEAGDFTNAVATAERSMAVATAAGEEGFAAINRQLLPLYRAGKPWHEPVERTVP